MDYEYYSNKNKTLVVDNLVGNSNYIFKYFCVNQLGFPSGGQILSFTTGSTNYGLNKVELRFNKLLTVGQANLLACYIAEVVRTPYSTVTSSTFSNCLNTSFVYYPTATTTYFDYPVGNIYSYYFYIDSYTVITPDILSILPQNLSIYSRYIQNIPPYSFISMYLLNNSALLLLMNMILQQSAVAFRLLRVLSAVRSMWELSHLILSWPICRRHLTL